MKNKSQLYKSNQVFSKATALKFCWARFIQLTHMPSSSPSILACSVNGRRNHPSQTPRDGGPINLAVRKSSTWHAAPDVCAQLTQARKAQTKYHVGTHPMGTKKKKKKIKKITNLSLSLAQFLSYIIFCFVSFHFCECDLRLRQRHTTTRLNNH